MSTNLLSALSADGEGYHFSLLIEQLKNQDPMDPVSNSEMVTQMAQLATLEEIGYLNTSFRDMLKLQTLMGGAGLLGREVEYLDGGLLERGIVESIAADGQSARLMVNDTEVKLNDVERIF